MRAPPERKRIVVFGDVIDDIVVVPSGPVRAGTDTPSSIRHIAGGSAANTASWLGRLGAPVDFVGIVGAERAETHSSLLVSCGVTPHLRVDPDLPTGTIVIVVDGQARTMLTERGANSRIDPEDVTDAMLDAAGILHLTGYSVFDSRDPAALARLIDRATRQGVAVSVDPGSVGFLADYGAGRFLEAVGRADMIFPNLDEGRLLSGQSNPLAIVDALAKRFAVVALTLATEGVIVAREGRAPVHVKAIPSRVVDPTGAGDAFSAGFLYSWLSDGNAASAARAGVRLAATAVTTIGGRPPA